MLLGVRRKKKSWGNKDEKKLLRVRKESRRVEGTRIQSSCPQEEERRRVEGTRI